MAEASIIATATITVTAAESSVDWYSLSTEEVCRRLEVEHAVGLADAEVVNASRPVRVEPARRGAARAGWKAFLPNTRT